MQGKKIAIVATDGFEQVEVTEPKKALEEAGATVHVISPKPGQIKGWKFTEWGEKTNVDRTLDEAKTLGLRRACISRRSNQSRQASH